MVNRFETYFVAYYAYFTAKLHQFLKTLGHFENLVFVIMSTRENIRLIARSSFHLGRYIVGYTVGNLVLRQRTSGAVKRDFRTYIRRYTSPPNENFEYGYLHSDALLQFCLKLEHCKPNKAACHPTLCDVINYIKLLPTVCCKFLTLSNQTSRYKSKYIRIWFYLQWLK